MTETLPEKLVRLKRELIEANATVGDLKNQIGEVERVIKCTANEHGEHIKSGQVFRLNGHYFAIYAPSSGCLAAPQATLEAYHVPDITPE